jgi:hypothetical protein
VAILLAKVPRIVSHAALIVVPRLFAVTAYATPTKISVLVLKTVVLPRRMK